MENPKLIVEGVSGNVLNQGAIGNCWFIAAYSCLAQKKEIWHKVGFLSIDLSQK